jgi:hypothetical protein
MYVSSPLPPNQKITELKKKITEFWAMAVLQLYEE